MKTNSAAKKAHLANRHQGRELALQLLYAIEITHNSLKDVLDAYQTIEIEDKLPMNDFTQILLETVVNNLAQVDEHLKSVITNWKLDRLSFIDRNLLRLAVAEINYFEDIPPKVTINEYIEIAKDFGDKDSPSFVNGILDSIARKSEKGKDIKSLNDQDAQH